MPYDRNRVLLQTLLYGTLSALLYCGLYLFADSILEISRQGHWSFLVPIGIAFLFSFVHGNFTGQFWDLFGVKARQVKG